MAVVSCTNARSLWRASRFIVVAAGPEGRHKFFAFLKWRARKDSNL